MKERDVRGRCRVITSASVMEGVADHAEAIDPQTSSLDLSRFGAVTQQTPVQAKPRQTRDRGLQGGKAIIKRQQGRPAKSGDHRLFLNAQNRRMRFRRVHWPVCH